MKIFVTTFLIVFISIQTVTAMKGKDGYNPISPQYRLNGSLSHLLSQLKKQNNSELSKFTEAAHQTSVLQDYLHDHIPDEKTLPYETIDAVKVLEEGIVQLPSLWLSDATSTNHHINSMLTYIQELKAICTMNLAPTDKK